MISRTLNSTAVTFIGENHDRMVGSWIVQVSGTFSGTLRFRKKLPASVVTNANAPLTDSEDFCDFTAIDKATGVTAAGLYKVVCDGCALILDYTHVSGAMVVELEPMIG
jgi:hypothetical protein